MLCFCCGRILLASAYYKNLNSRARLFKKLDTRQWKFYELSIHSISTKMIIETSREYFSISIFGRKYRASFYNVLVLRKNFVWFTGTVVTAGCVVFWKHFPAAGYLDTTFFVCHLSSPCFQFLIGRKTDPGQARSKQTTRYCRLTTHVGVKCLFLAIKCLSKQP